jgi:heme A synthase
MMRRWLAGRSSLSSQSSAARVCRSARLVRGQWWRTASLSTFVTGVALLLAPLVGALLLFGTSASFDVVNLASDVVYTVSLPFAAIATTYLYCHLSLRRSAGEQRLGGR